MTTQDNYITTEKKARWGFAGTADEITVGSGSKNDGEKSIKGAAKSAGAAGGNGGGEK